MEDQGIGNSELLAFSGCVLRFLGVFPFCVILWGWLTFETPGSGLWGPRAGGLSQDSFSFQVSFRGSRLFKILCGAGLTLNMAENVDLPCFWSNLAMFCQIWDPVCLVQTRFGNIGFGLLRK